MVIIPATSAIVSVLAWLPRPSNETASTTGSDGISVKADFEAAIDIAPEEKVARVTVKCAECGVVESISEIVQILERMESGAASKVKRTCLKDTVVKSISNYPGCFTNLPHYVNVVPFQP